MAIVEPRLAVLVDNVRRVRQTVRIHSLVWTCDDEAVVKLKGKSKNLTCSAKACVKRRFCVPG